MYLRQCWGFGVPHMETPDNCTLPKAMPAARQPGQAATACRRQLPPLLRHGYLWLQRPATAFAASTMHAIGQPATNRTVSSKLGQVAPLMGPFNSITTARPTLRCDAPDAFLTLSSELTCGRWRSGLPAAAQRRTGRASEPSRAAGKAGRHRGQERLTKMEW